MIARQAFAPREDIMVIDSDFEVGYLVVVFALLGVVLIGGF